MIRFLKDRMSSISSDLYEEILKLNKSHTNCIIQIAPCKTAFRITMIVILYFFQQVNICSKSSTKTLEITENNPKENIFG